MKNRKYINTLIVILVILIIAMAPLHPLKMSFSKLETKSNGKLEVTTKLFIDDLTDLLMEKYRLEAVSFNGLESQGTKALQTYFSETFKFIQNNEVNSLKITSVKVIEDGVVLLVVSKSEKAIDSSQPISLLNTLFFEKFPNQMNSVKTKDKELRFHLRNKQMVINE